MDINGNEYSTDLKSINALQFQRITNAMNDQGMSNVEKWINVFTAFGIPKQEVEELDYATFLEKIKEASNVSQEGLTEIHKTIEVDGYTYSLYGGGTSATTKDMRTIEKFNTAYPNDSVMNMFAILYKRDDLTNTEHYEKAHITHKRKLFAKLPAAIVVPLIADVSKSFANVNSTELAGGK